MSGVSLNQNFSAPNISSEQISPVNSPVEQDHWSIKALQSIKETVQNCVVSPVYYGSIEILQKGSKASWGSIIPVTIFGGISFPLLITGRGYHLKRAGYVIAALYTADFMSTNERARNLCSAIVSFICSIQISRKDPVITGQVSKPDVMNFPAISFPVAVGIGSLAIGALVISILLKKKQATQKQDDAGKKTSKLIQK